MVLGVAREGGLSDAGVGDQNPGGQGGGGQVAQRQQQVDQSLLGGEISRKLVDNSFQLLIITILE